MKLIMEEFWNLSNEQGFCENPVSANFNHNLVEGFEGVPLHHNSPDFSFGLAVPDHGIGNTSPSKTVEAEFMEEAYFHNPALKCINGVLMDEDALEYMNLVLMEEDAEEEDAEDEAYFTGDSTLHAAEKAFYDILNEIHFPSPSEPIHHLDSVSLDATISTNPGCCFNGYVNVSNFTQTGIINDFCNSSHVLNPPVNKTFLCKPLLDYNLGSSSDTFDGPMSMQPPTIVPVDSQFSVQFKWGMRECKRVSERKAAAEKNKDELTNRLQRGRSLLGENDLEEGRGSNQLGISTEDFVLSEILDKLLHFTCEKDEATSNSSDGLLPKNGHTEEHSRGASCLKKQINIKYHFDMKNLLIQCMESVANNDHNTADKLLKQLKQWSSPSGNASKRLAKCFAKGLEARLAGTGNLIYKSLTAMVRSTSDALEAHNLSNSAIPFMNASHYYGIQTILETAKKATSLHIIEW